MKLTRGLPVLLTLTAACGPPADRTGSRETEASPGPAPAHWGYEGDEAPAHWADLSPEYAPCRDGREQSPVDLTDAVPVSGVAVGRVSGTAVLTLDERAHVMDLIDNGHTIQVANDVPLSLDLDGEHFELVQYHFHAPSEHAIDGERALLEVHFVHKSAAGNLAVAAVLVDEGPHNSVADPLLAALPSGPDDPRHLEGLELDIEEFHPLPQHYYRYEGSLTTPPCSEGVRWIVSAEKRQMSSEQLAAITSHLHQNNRPLQPRGDREIALVSP